MLSSSSAAREQYRAAASGHAARWLYALSSLPFMTWSFGAHFDGLIIVACTLMPILVTYVWNVIHHKPVALKVVIQLPNRCKTVPYRVIGVLHMTTNEVARRKLSLLAHMAQ